MERYLFPYLFESNPGPPEVRPTIDPARVASAAAVGEAKRDLSTWRAAMYRGLETALGRVPFVEEKDAAEEWVLIESGWVPHKDHQPDHPGREVGFGAWTVSDLNRASQILGWAVDADSVLKSPDFDALVTGALIGWYFTAAPLKGLDNAAQAKLAHAAGKWAFELDEISPARVRDAMDVQFRPRAERLKWDPPRIEKYIAAVLVQMKKIRLAVSKGLAAEAIEKDYLP